MKSEWRIGNPDLRMLVIAIADIVEGLIMLITLGIIRPDLALAAAMWRARKRRERGLPLNSSRRITGSKRN